MNTVMRRVMVIVGLLLIGSFAAGSAAAHATSYSPDGKIKFVYGHLNEPTYTFVKTGLDLGIYDNATGKGIGGLDTDARQGDAAGAPKIFVSYRYGGEGGTTKNISGDFRAQHGQVGKYTHPITFTRPGIYSILLSGTINGTTFDEFVIAPAHAVEGQDEIMWPDQFGTDDEQIERIEALEAKLEQLDSDNGRAAAAGVESLPLIAAIALIALMVRRRAA